MIVKRELYLNASTNYTITDQDGSVLEIEQAKALFDAGEVDDWNMAFGRLATQFNWDLEAVRKFYRPHEYEKEKLCRT